MRSKTPSYTVEYPVVFDDPSSESFFLRLIRTAISIYNDCLGECLKRLHKIQHDRDYQQCLEQLKLVKKSHISDKEKKKQLSSIYQDIQDICLSYGYSEYSMHEYVKKPCHYFKNVLGSHECQKLATRAYRAVERYRYHEADRVNFKSIRYDLISIEGKSHTSKLRYDTKDGCVHYGKHILLVRVKQSDEYGMSALMDKVKYVRLCPRYIRNKVKWYIQLVFEGLPPSKNRRYDKDTIVGLDIGTSTLAVSTKGTARLIELAPDCSEDERLIRLYQRKLDRSRRATNPENYNEDGTIKHGKLKPWVKSKKYLHYQSRLRETYRRMAAKRKQCHEKLSNEILSLGIDVRVEDMSFKGLQRRSKNTTIKKSNGRYNSKKRFGRVIRTRAPSMFLSILDRKLHYVGKQLNKVNTYKVKASQYNPLDGSYKKKELVDRMIQLDDNVIVQRDMLSAYVIAHTTDKLDSIDKTSCLEDFERFWKLQDLEIQNLKENNQLGWYIH